MGNNDGAADDLSSRRLVPRDDGREAVGNSADFHHSRPNARLVREMGGAGRSPALAARHADTTGGGFRKRWDAPGVLEGDVQELLRLLDRFTRQPRDFSWHPHPIFGAMTDAEWMRWGYLHTDHHLRQFGA